MRTLAITSGYTGKLAQTPAPTRTLERVKPKHGVPTEQQLAAQARHVPETYASPHHNLVFEGVRAVWDRWGQNTLDVAILSAGLGLLDAEQSIIPYDGMSADCPEGELVAWAQRLGLAERAQALAARYDLVFYLLSGQFLEVLELPLDVPQHIQQIALTDRESMALLPDLPNLHGFVADGSAAAQRWHVKASYVRGFLFKRLCRQIAWHGPSVLEWLRAFPQDTEKLFYKRVRWRPQLPMW